MDFPTGKRTFMELRPRSDVERRSGHDRRKRSDPHYRGPERRSGLDRRAASLGTRRAYGEPLAAWTDAPAARAHRLVPAKGHHFLSPLVVAMRKVPLYTGVRGTLEELVALHDQAVALADILCQWNNDVGSKAC